MKKLVHCDICKDQEHGCLICNFDYYDRQRSSILGHSPKVILDIDNMGRSAKVVLFTRHKLDFDWRTEKGLGLCVTCGGAEGSLPTHCPQKKMGSYMERLVGHGDADFVDGLWVSIDKKEVVR